MQQRKTEDSQFLVFVSASFFLVAPILVLMFIARRTERPRTPGEDYQTAVRDTVQPDSAHVSRSLVTVSFGQPVKVVTWTRKKNIPDYKKQNAPAYKDTWVTIASNLRSFCQDYVKSNGADSTQLTQRLEQRLGLPLHSGYDTFIELTVTPKDISEFFRPCNDPDPTTKKCEVARPCWEANANSSTCLPRTPALLKDDLNDPKKKQALENRYWSLNQYYNSFASQNQYPWTFLGYTFDWAPNDAGNDLVRFGESEFVIPAGAPIQYVSDTDTVTYCTPQ